MIKNPDGSITLLEEDVERLNALISWSAGKLRSPGVYSTEAATVFAREWGTTQAPDAA